MKSLNTYFKVKSKYEMGSYRRESGKIETKKREIRVSKIPGQSIHNLHPCRSLGFGQIFLREYGKGFVLESSNWALVIVQRRVYIYKYIYIPFVSNTLQCLCTHSVLHTHIYTLYLYICITSIIAHIYYTRP